jgi:ABC-type uncharacterized transport system substrate-binding protein
MEATMTRRTIGLLVIFVCLVAPLAAEAQPAGTVYRIAIVLLATPVAEITASESSHPMQAFLGELRRLGYVDGQNLAIEWRSGEGQPERYPELVAEVVHLNPDLILAVSSRLARLFKAATTAIPIVAITADPIKTNVVTNLARPGGNLTGVSVDPGEELLGKRLALLKEALPELSSVAVLSGVSDPPGLRQLLDDAPRLGLTVRDVLMASPYREAQYTDAFRIMTQDKAQAVLVSDQAEHFANRRLIVALAARQQLPGMYPFREFVEVGGLMAYGVANRDLHRRAAGYVDRILKGATPGDLPFEQPTTFELVINLKTAEALGISIPPTLLFQATEVIR